MSFGGLSPGPHAHRYCALAGSPPALGGFRYEELDVVGAVPGKFVRCSKLAIVGVANVEVNQSRSGTTSPLGGVLASALPGPRRVEPPVVWRGKPYQRT